jgi:hypothetical protein
LRHIYDQSSFAHSSRGAVMETQKFETFLTGI